ncbi:unnamed protein product [Trypanosoma congolense IL3000]|uniref:WGS project CAEQ00000000 data, annotated contig 698 n=1 Tax=Trypanosoma congolense (strain IL3000) TaxID=1068625 RepID=F9WHV9_TRYCI|nr:unnamed protein product [Trypanosoma congolense IL3000]
MHQRATRNRQGMGGGSNSRNMEESDAAVGEQQQMIKRCNLPGMLFGHDAQTVSLSEKMILRSRESPPLEKETVEQVECVVSRMIYAVGVRVESPSSYCFPLKIVRWRLSRPSRGLACPSDPGVLPENALILAKMRMKSRLKAYQWPRHKSCRQRPHW